VLDHARVRSLWRSDRFRVDRLLGTGSSGTVVEAWDHARGESIALKIFRQATPSARASLSQQLSLFASCRHPSLLRTFELIEQDDALALSMELVEGTDVVRWLHAKGSFDIERLRSLVAQLVGALATLHAAGLVHRDVKPGNILVTAEGRAVLLDYGLVAHVGDLMDPGVGVGTPSYMAPEQVASEPVGPAADFYALGVVLFELLAGNVPHPDSAKQPNLKLQHSAPPLGEQSVDLGPETQAWASVVADLLSRSSTTRPRARAILRRLGIPYAASSATLPYDFDVRPRFCGRRAEVARLEEAATQVEGGDSRWLHVSGVSGLGKTTLLSELARRLLGRGFDAVEVSGCDELGSPYGALDRLITHTARATTLCPSTFDQQSGRALSKMWPGLARADRFSLPIESADALDVRTQAEQALARWLDQVCAERPLAFLIDDFEKLPRDAVRVLRNLLERGDVKRLLVVSAAGGPGSESARAESVGLSPMTPEEIRELATDFVTKAGAGPMHELPPLTKDGNPGLAIDAAVARLCSGTLAERIERLAGPAYGALLSLCTAAAPVLREPWREATALTSRELSTALLALEGEALIEITQNELGETVREPARGVAALVLARASSASRREAHLSWASVWSRAQVDRSSLAFWHYAQADESVLGLSHARKGATEADRRLAFLRAAELRLAEDNVTESVASEADRKRLRQLADTLVLAGDLASAAAACERAQAGAMASEALLLEARRGELLLRAGMVAQGLVSMQRVLDSVGLTMPTSPRNAITRLLWHQLCLKVAGTQYRERGERQVPPKDLIQLDTMEQIGRWVNNVNPIYGTELMTRALRHALRLGEPRRATQLLLVSGWFQGQMEAPPLRKAAAIIDAATERAQGLNNPKLLADAEASAGGIAYLTFDLPRAVEGLERAESLLANLPAHGNFDLLTTRELRLSARLFRGDYVALARDANDKLRQAEEQGDRWAWSSLSTVAGYMLLLCEGAPDAALERLNQAEAIWRHEAVQTQDLHLLFGRWVIAQYTMDRGFLESVTPLIQRLRGALFARIGLCAALITLVEIGGALLALPSDPPPKELARIERLIPKTSPYPWLAAELERFRGVVASARGEHAEARAAFALYRNLRVTCGCEVHGVDVALALIAGTPPTTGIPGVRDPEHMARLHGLLGVAGAKV